jgi:hypothetical protein
MATITRRSGADGKSAADWPRSEPGRFRVGAIELSEQSIAIASTLNGTGVISGDA